MTRSEELFQRAVKRIPGGVNSPVRAFGSVDEAPDLSREQLEAKFLMWTEMLIQIISVPGDL